MELKIAQNGWKQASADMQAFMPICPMLDI